LKISNEPNLIKVGATLITTAQLSSITFPVYNLSRYTVESDTVRLAARVVGIPKAHIASEHKNSLIEDLKTALPSADLEYGVNPAPLSCKSKRRHIVKLACSRSLVLS
jgi:hypothetical protein